MFNIKLSHLYILLNLAFMLALSSVSIFAMDDPKLGAPGYSSADTIFMKIFPSSTFEVSAKDRPIVDMIFVSLEGNFKENQVQLVSSERCKSAPQNMTAFLNDGTTILYSPETLEEALNSGGINRYPLAWHKQFKNLPEGTKICLVECDVNGKEVAQINLPVDIAKKILQYLTLDLESEEKDCGNFLRAMRFNFSDRYIGDTKGGLHNHIQIPKQSVDVQVGEAAVFFDISALDFCIFHYALALGNGMYLSKHGYGGPLMVAGVQSMLNFWGGKYFGTLDQEATENPHVWSNGARIDPRRPENLNSDLTDAL